MELSPSFWGRGSASQVNNQRTFFFFNSPGQSGFYPQQCKTHNSHSGNHTLDSFFKGAESRQHPQTLVEQFELAASWDPLAVPSATEQHPQYI